MLSVERTPEERPAVNSISYSGSSNPEPAWAFWSAHEISGRSVPWSCDLAQVLESAPGQRLPPAAAR